MTVPLRRASLDVEIEHIRLDRERFLEEMEQLIPWPEPAAVIEPFYPKPAGAGRDHDLQFPASAGRP